MSLKTSFASSLLKINTLVKAFFANQCILIIKWVKYLNTETNKDMRFSCYICMLIVRPKIAIDHFVNLQIFINLGNHFYLN
jgi:hypothetical protein